MPTKGKFYHYSLAPWDQARWPNFTADQKRLACHHCGEFWYDESYFDALQHARDIVGKPIIVNSGHRCPEHNASVSKAKNAKTSQHLRLAFDLSLQNFQEAPHVLLAACITAGFTSVGLAKTFIHVDKRPGRFWTYGQEAEDFWRQYVNCNFVKMIFQNHKILKRKTGEQ
jgi:uncharacterized protein YcbK (DUF882 family)